MALFLFGSHLIIPNLRCPFLDEKRVSKLSVRPSKRYHQANDGPQEDRCRRPSTSRVHGSHESEADIEAIMPEQHAVLAAAAARKSGKEPATVHATIRKKSANQKGMKTFVFKKLAAEPASPPIGKIRKGANKLSPAMFSVVRAKYQKGDLKDSFTGAVYFSGAGRATATTTRSRRR